jgi:hypothetical protein
VAGLGPRRHSVPGTRDLRPAPRDERAQQPYRAVIGPSLVYPSESERARPDGRDHIQSHSVHFQPHVVPHSVHVGVHARGSPCLGTSGNLWRSTPDGGNHVGLCDRHVETRGPKGIRIHWGVPTFHGAASPTPHRGIPGGNSFGYYLVSPLFVSGVRGRVKSRPVSAFVGVKGEGHPDAPGQAS